MQDFTTSLKSFLDFTVFDLSLGKLALAILVFAFFLLTRKLFSKFLFGIVKPFVAKSETKLDDAIFEALNPPLNLVFVIIGIYFAKDILQLPQGGELFVDNIIRTLVAFFIFWVLYRLLNPVSDLLKDMTQKKLEKDISSDIVNFIIKSLRVLVVAVGFVAILQEWGYNVSGFLASLGLVGMAFALAAKDTAANLFGSLVIFIDRPFKVGDWIKTPDVEGTVEEIGVRSTKVRTFAQALVAVPNATLGNSAIINWSRMGKRRIKMNLGLTYDTDSSKMNKILNRIRELLKNDSEIHPDTIYINFTDFNDSSLGIFCYFFTNTTKWGEYMDVRERINLEIMKIVEEEGLSFAFPSQSIYVEKTSKTDMI